MVCWHCGTRLCPGSAACPFCGQVVCPDEAVDEPTFEVMTPEPSRLDIYLASWERFLKTPRRRRTARIALEGALAALLVLLSVGAWRGFVSGAWGNRLPGLNQICF